MKSYLIVVTCVVLLAVIFTIGCEPETSTQSYSKTVAESLQTEKKIPQDIVTTTAPQDTSIKAEPTEAKTTESADVAKAPEETAAAEQPAKIETVVTEQAEKPAEVIVEKPAEPAAKLAKGVVATVNGEEITQSSLDKDIKPQLDKMAASAGKLPPNFIEQYKEKMKKQALDRLITEKLLSQKAKEAQITVTDEDLNQQLEKAASQQNMSVQQLKGIIEQRGQSFDEVKEQLREGLTYQKLFEHELSNKLNITEADANEYYCKNKTQFTIPEQIRASHILITPKTNEPNISPEEAKAKARQKAEELLKKVNAGVDFAQLAGENSDCPSARNGGDLGFFSKGQMVPEFEAAAFNLEPGLISDIVETQHGYHIIKVTGHKDANDLSFEQAKNEIMTMLTQNRQNELARKYIESLKSGANIVYADTNNVEKKLEPVLP